MASWTTPKTWTVGEVLTAAELNAQLRDNLNAIRLASIVTATGVNGNWITGTTIQTDELGGWAVGQPYFGAPWSGRFHVTFYSAWSGATGAGEMSAKVDRFDSTATVLLEDVCEADTSQLNGKVSCAGLVQMNPGDRLYFGHSWGATGNAGTVTARITIEARG